MMGLMGTSAMTAINSATVTVTLRRKCISLLIPALIFLSTQTVNPNAATGQSDVANTAADHEVIEAAESEAVSRGLTVEGMAVHVQAVGEFWEVIFSDPDWNPNMLGGNGFVVRLQNPSREFVQILRFQ